LSNTSKKKVSIRIISGIEFQKSHFFEAKKHKNKSFTNIGERLVSYIKNALKLIIFMYNKLIINFIKLNKEYL